jgi:hypothetical protein
MVQFSLQNCCQYQSCSPESSTAGAALLFHLSLETEPSHGTLYFLQTTRLQTSPETKENKP